jgi:predicted Zn-dependent protease
MPIRVAVLLVVTVCFSEITSAAPAQTPDARTANTLSSNAEGNSQTTNQAAVQAAYEQAMGLLQEGKAADALAVIDAAVRGGARDASLYNLKGLAASELGRDAEAEESFRAVIRLWAKSARCCEKLSRSSCAGSAEFYGFAWIGNCAGGAAEIWRSGGVSGKGVVGAARGFSGGIRMGARFV